MNALDKFCFGLALVGVIFTALASFAIFSGILVDPLKLALLLLQFGVLVLSFYCIIRSIVGFPNSRNGTLLRVSCICTASASMLAIVGISLWPFITWFILAVVALPMAIAGLVAMIRGN